MVVKARSTATSPPDPPDNVPPATGAKTVIASNLDIGLPPYQGGPPGLVPTGVAVGAGGTVYVSSDIRNALYKLTPPAP